MLSINDFKTALHSLLKAKGYVITVVLTLGITLGTLVSMFNLSYQLLAKSLPYPDADQLVIANPSIYRDGHLDFSGMVPLPALIEAYKIQDTYLLQKALFMRSESIIANLLHTPKVNLGYVTPEYLQLIDASLLMGRHFSDAERIDSYNPNVLLSYSLWVKEFNRDPDILGKSIELEKNSFKIIGVLSPDFVEPELQYPGYITNIWVPWDYIPRDKKSQEAWGRFSSGHFIVGKLNPGTHIQSIEQVLSDFLNRLLNNALPELQQQKLQLQFSLVTYKEKILGDVQSRLVIFFIAALVLLLIALVNITNLILARTSNQQKKLAIKAALGAGKLHLFREILAEILLLLGITLWVSLAVSLLEVELIKHWFGNYLPRISHLSFDWVSLLFAIGLSFLLAFILAFVVIRKINYRMLNQWLQMGGKSTGIQISETLRRLLIFIQLTFTLILLVSSIHILILSINHIRQPLGFSTENLYKVIINTAENLSIPVGRDYHQKLLDIRKELLTHPQIKQVSLASGVPMTDELFDHLSMTADYKQLEQTRSTFIDPQYLSMMKFTFIAGNNFTESDFNSGSGKIIINQTLAKRLQLDRNLSGKMVYWKNGGGKNSIIGIVRDLSLPGQLEDARMYIPALAGYNPTEIILELKTDQSISQQQINTIFARVDARYKAAELVSIDAIHQEFIRQDIILALLTFVLTLLSLTITAIGIYGVLSYSVQLSRHELGIRMALGASPLKILWDFVKNHLLSLIIGAVISFAFLYYLIYELNAFEYRILFNIWGWAIPILLILSLTMAVSLLSVWNIIRKPASYILRGE